MEKADFNITTLCVCVCPLPLGNRLTHFYETWYEPYAVREQPDIAIPISYNKS
jgi:hypothetical protein